MRAAVRLAFLTWMCLVSLIVLNAQVTEPLASLTLSGEPRSTQVPASVILGTPQCDSLGTIYLRYSTADWAFSATLASIEQDGTTQTISLDRLPGTNGDTHTFLFAADNDGSLHEIVRTAEPEANQQATSSDIRYVRFDSDGALRSQTAFTQEFIPSTLLPLPSGNFFASGVTLDEGNNGDVSESPLIGIFNADAKLERHLHRDSGKLVTVSTANAESDDTDDAILHAQDVTLGDDGNIYILMGSDHAKVAVVTQAGRILREMKLQEPFETDVASGIWTSGNRLLVVYEGEADDPKDSYAYVLYDAQSGELIRAYKPDFLGTVACFEDGRR